MVEITRSLFERIFSQKIDEPRLVPFKGTIDFKLKSLIMAQIERWRQA